MTTLPHATIRPLVPGDRQAIVELSLRAWTPVFASLEQRLGAELFVRLHGDWSAFQTTAVSETLADRATRAWVADVDGQLVGFVAARLHEQRRLGEITMVAVEPTHQRRGIGSRLTAFATDWLRHSGMQVAMVETGGDPGHHPPRRLYEKYGYTPLMITRYFKTL